VFQLKKITSNLYALHRNESFQYGKNQVGMVRAYECLGLFLLENQGDFAGRLTTKALNLRLQTPNSRATPDKSQFDLANK
jgi:hypothetical protein